jgi:DNA polymerase-4
MDRLRGHVDEVESMGLDEAYLELTGLIAPRAAMRRVISEIRADTGLTASVGIGPNKLVAKVASDAEKPAGFVVLTREEACRRFAGASPRLLPGIGAKTAERLERMGITTISRLGATPDETLAGVFGERLGPYLARRGRFEDDSRVTMERVAVSESRETTFNTDVASRDEQVMHLRRLSEQLCTGMRKHGRRGRTIAIKVRLDDFTTVTRARTVPEATDDAERVADVACALLAEYDPPRPVRLLGVRLAAFEEAAADGPPQLALPV